MKLFCQCFALAGLMLVWIVAVLVYAVLAPIISKIKGSASFGILAMTVIWATAIWSIGVIEERESASRIPAKVANINPEFHPTAWPREIDPSDDISTPGLFAKHYAEAHEHR